MAANRFATMVHRNSNKITLILIYAVLEWVLIVLLLLNSLFSYLILKFAEYFGLKPPCSWCARVDHVLDSSREGKNVHRDNLCEVHAREVSGLGFCANHRKLVESRDMCEDCLSTTPEFRGSSKDFAVLNGLVENGEVSSNCLCCGANLVDNKYSSYALVRTSSWDLLECAHKENLIDESGNCDDDEDNHNHVQKVFDSDINQGLCDDKNLLENKNEESEMLSGFDDNTKNVNPLEEEKGTLLEEKSNLSMVDKSVQVCFLEDASPEACSPHLEFFLDYSGHRLVPIELVDSMTEEQKSGENTELEDDDKNKDHEFSQHFEARFEEHAEPVVESGGRTEKLDTFLDIDINEEPEYGMLYSMELEEDENSLVFHATDRHIAIHESANLANDVHTDDVVCEEVTAQSNNENEADVSIGTEIPDLDITGEIQIKESISNECDLEAENSGETRVDEPMVELQSLSLPDNEDDKVPDTPTSIDSFNNLHKKLLMLEKLDSGAEESLDGSITSELDVGDGAVTVERLKSALRAERKALQVLYTELEEERSASAVAANQTMAMINRLQEEKAAVQMEALQYQRMMEEQSEYDQEALQLLNELMVKREKEKQELEKELEACRKRLLDYEMKEKVRLLRRSKDGSAFSSASCSNTEDSDGLSIDLNQEVKEDDGFYSLDTPAADAVFNLEESLADFEDERLSILEQLKVLEEKLTTLDEENGHHFEDVKAVDNDSVIEHFNSGHTNGFPNGKSKIAAQMGKSLLPLFDATSNDIENGDSTPNGNGIDSSEDSNFDKENKKHAIEEEVDHLYERLQALEADREFLKHCIGSLKKGDKGTDLLQEILQHLRDLRNVELRVRNNTE